MKLHLLRPQLQSCCIIDPGIDMRSSLNISTPHVGVSSHHVSVKSRTLLIDIPMTRFSIRNAPQTMNSMNRNAMYLHVSQLVCNMYVDSGCIDIGIKMFV